MCSGILAPRHFKHSWVHVVCTVNEALGEWFDFPSWRSMEIMSIEEQHQLLVVGEENWA